MNEIEMRRKRCCFTGHRPEKLTVAESALVSELESAIDEAIAAGFRTFISGMCRGTDLWAAAIVLRRRKAHPDIRLICAVPHPGFENHWCSEWRQLYHDIISQADLVRTISPTYSKGCYQIRNCWMVDHSALVIAAYNGSPGGTQNTIYYAEKQGILVRRIQA